MSEQQVAPDEIERARAAIAGVECQMAERGALEVCRPIDSGAFSVAVGVDAGGQLQKVYARRYDRAERDREKLTADLGGENRLEELAHEETACPVCEAVVWPAAEPPVWGRLWWPCAGRCEADALRMGWRRDPDGGGRWWRAAPRPRQAEFLT